MNERVKMELNLVMAKLLRERADLDRQIADVIEKQCAEQHPQDQRELRGCMECPREWLDNGDGPCPFCGHTATEIRTSFFTKYPSQREGPT